jgi:sugar/nucleoside kinase (ribokinase family)
MKKIAVLGPIPRDHIITWQGEIITRYGAVSHPVIALAKLIGANNQVIPVSHIRRQDEAAIKSEFNDYKNVITDYITSDTDKGDVISLKFLDKNNRLEQQTGFMNPILPEDIHDLMDSDLFVFVPISDYEIALDTLAYIKANSKGVIVFDAHGPTTACLINGKRERRFWFERDQWLPYIDVLKMNAEEAACCWFKKEFEADEMAKEQELSEEERRNFAHHCLDSGVKCVYITLDSRGCMAYYSKDNSYHETMIPAMLVANVVDTTGCGDSFAGGLAFGLLDDNTDYIKAARYANVLGALRTQGRTWDVFKSLEETNKIIAKTYF